jgi:hypothetical protein
MTARFNPSDTAVARRRLSLWPNTDSRRVAARRLVGGEPLNEILADYADDPVRTKDDGSPAPAPRRWIYGEYAIKQEAVRAGLVDPIDPDDIGAMRRAVAPDGMAWVECRTGLSGGTIRKRLREWRPAR